MGGGDEAGPPGRVNAAAAYEAGRGKAVIAGGSRKAGASWQVVEDSWEGDRSGWQRMADIPARDHHALVEDGRGIVHVRRDTGRTIRFLAE